jgi:hypothetical protein
MKKIKLIGDLSPEIPQVLLGKTVSVDKYTPSNGACFFTYYNRGYVVWPENYEEVEDKAAAPPSEVPEFDPNSITKASALWWVGVMAGDYHSGEDARAQARAKLEEMIRLLLPE